MTVPLSECVDVFSLCSLQAGGPCQGGSRGDPRGSSPPAAGQSRAWGISNWEPGGKHFQAPRDKAGMLWWHRRGREAELFLTPDTSRWLWAEGTAKHQRSWSRAGEFPAQAVLLLSQGRGRHRGSSVPSAISFRGNESPGHSWSCSPLLSVLRALHSAGRALAVSVCPCSEQSFCSSAQDHGISSSELEQPTALLLLHLGAQRGLRELRRQQKRLCFWPRCSQLLGDFSINTFV